MKHEHYTCQSCVGELSRQTLSRQGDGDGDHDNDDNDNDNDNAGESLLTSKRR
jgi:hypothetical protein